VPDPVKRERSWENITKGVDSRFFLGAVKRFDIRVAQCPLGDFQGANFFDGTTHM
jgi:hypothetical protein